MSDTQTINIQTIYMQARLVRLAADEWKKPVSEVNRIFAANDVYGYIAKLWEMFHIEGDMAVLEDIQEYLKNKGVTV